jgi:hypothetical protein
MKTRYQAACGLIFLILLTAAKALSPLPPKSLEERVILASHVFVGKIVESREFPSEDSMGSFGHVLYRVALENLIWPQEGWYSHDLVTIRGIHGFDFGGDGVVGQRRIFIVSKGPGDNSVFVSPHDRETSVSLEEMSDAIRAIYKKSEMKLEGNHAVERTPVAVAAENLHR